MPFLKVGSVLCLLASLTARANVFGPDHRVPVTSGAYPTQAIGPVRQLARDHVRESCTGTLIGRRLVLTAAHCVAREGSALSPTIATVFVSPDRRAHQAVGVWAGNWHLESDPRGGDWAVLLLADDAGGETLPVVAETIRPGQHLALLGFSVDLDHGEVLTGDFDCRVHLALPDGVFHHDCALFAGASGGPILVSEGEGSATRWKIIGVQSAHKSDGTIGLKLAGYDSKHANLGISAANFAKTVEQLRQQFEKPFVPQKPTVMTAGRS